MTENKLTIEELSTFCKRKGFVFRSSEIYGGFSGFWDYGPLGIEFYNNLKNAFWKYFVHQKENMTGIEASIISHPRTWIASGHLTSFTDVAVTCKKCKNATKIDKSEIDKVKCEKCGGDYIVQGEFNLLFKTNVGALNSQDAYLRGETAQGMFMNFKLVQETSRKQLPFGIAQIGRCFRNEIAPRDFLFRCREFDIGEFEFFINPDEKKCNLLEDKHLNLKLMLLDSQTQESGKDKLKETTIGKMIKEEKLEEWHAYWLAEQLLWFTKLGLIDNIKVREHMKSELSFYSSATFDMDYLFPFGSKEVAGNANRGQYDLNQHIKESKESLDIYDEKSKKKIIPKVIEPTFGIGRIFLALLCKGYNFDKKRENVVLKIPAYLAPVKACVIPIIKTPELIKIAKDICNTLRNDWNISYDESGSIGRRYSRNDEIGTPICIAIDDQTSIDQSVTLRDRDTTEQIRVKISEIQITVKKIIEGQNFSSLGQLVKTRVKEKID